MEVLALTPMKVPMALNKDPSSSTSQVPLNPWCCICETQRADGMFQLCHTSPTPLAATCPTGQSCLFLISEKYSPVFVNEDKYITWRAGPYNSAAWNKYSTYLPLPPKVESGPFYFTPAKLELPRVPSAPWAL